AGLTPDAAMIVATARALKYHGGVPVPELDSENVAALTAGLDNLEAHVEAVRQFKVPVLIGLNRYPSDTEREYAAVRERCQRLVVGVPLADVSGRGGAGGEELARGLQKLLATERSGFQPLYALDDPITVKLDTIAPRIYGAGGAQAPARGGAAGRTGSSARRGSSARSPRPRAWATGSCRSAWRRPSAPSPTTRRG